MYLEWSEDSFEVKSKKIEKLHRQFGHYSFDGMVSLLKNSGISGSDVSKIVRDVIDKCTICKRHKRTPPRPVVSIPLSNKFNDVVALDLKKWKDGQILYIIDLFSRFTRGKLLKSKKPVVVMNAFVECWLGSGFWAT